ncbi:unnamed protein product [Caenorhabditis bovis]|uniref:G-protein coupled receptors family 1 profile domain-containing protein n=1 Tax=Caenorhabditis bovis TaxID=2654633 RepID=A0A8S1EB15_9PELO|nr:unnamed protein product [Caenorhabditis bovis]
MTTSTDLEIIRTCLLFFAIVGTFGNLNILCATYQNRSLRHKCGILLAILATCDTFCLLNELQSFIRMTLKLTESTLRACFWANISYVFIEPIEVYMILVMAVDRLIAINFVVFHRKIRHRRYIAIMVTPGIAIGFIFVVSFISCC